MPRRKLLAIVGLLALLAAMNLPPTAGHARSVADRLAAEHGCPRPLPPVALDSVRGLTPAERCGVLSAGLALLDTLDARHAAGRPADALDESYDPTTDRIWIFVEHYARSRDHTPGGGPRFFPPLSWREEALSTRHWIFTVSRGPREHRSSAMVWVDQRTGAAHVYDRVRR